MLHADEPANVRYLVRYSKMLNSRSLSMRLAALSQWRVHQESAAPASTPIVRKTLAGIAHQRPPEKKRQGAAD